MDSSNAMPSLGKLTANRHPKTSGEISYFTERQIQAYLVARDAIRRVRRNVSLASSFVPQRRSQR